MQLKLEREGNLALVNRIAELEKQEPLVWMNKYGHVASFKNDEYTAPLYTAPVHASDMSEEHVHKSDKDTLIKQAEEAFESAKGKGWVGLTDEDIDLYGLDEGVTDNKAPAWLVTYARGIEAKLKEKNT